MQYGRYNIGLQRLGGGGGGGGGGYYAVGNNAIYVQFKGFKGLVTEVLRKFFKIIL